MRAIEKLFWLYLEKGILFWRNRLMDITKLTMDELLGVPRDYHRIITEKLLSAFPIKLR